MEIEKTIEFDQVKLKWSSLALTKYAKDKIEKIVPFMSEGELRKNIKDTTESKVMIEKCGTNFCCIQAPKGVFKSWKAT